MTGPRPLHASDVMAPAADDHHVHYDANDYYHGAEHTQPNYHHNTYANNNGNHLMEHGHSHSLGAPGYHPHNGPLPAVQYSPGTVSGGHYNPYGGKISPGAIVRAVPMAATQATSRGTFCRNGELFAIVHPHHKRPHSAGPPAVSLRSAYREQYANANPDPNAKKMQPYNPEAMRNRLPVRFSSQAYRTAPRNPLAVKDVSHSAQFATTNQRFFPKHSRPSVGFTNPGIVAGRTSWRHRRLND
eukprot:PhM_4_TR18224/c0_g1_i1/m.63719